MVLQELNVKIGLLLDEFDKQAAKAKAQASSIEGAFKALKAGLISLGVFSFLKDAVAEFAEADRNSQMLSRRLQGLGGDWKANKAEVDAWADAMSRASGIEDDELKTSMLTMIDITKDYQAGMSLMQDAMDLSVAKSMDLKQTSDLVARAYQGDQRALMELGRMFGVSRDKASDFGVVMKAMRQNIEGTATNIDDLTKNLKSNVTLWSQFKENVGGSISGLVNFVSKGIRPTIEFLGKMKEAQDTAFGGLYRLAGNIKTLFTRGYKDWQSENKQIVKETLDHEREVFQKHEEDKTKITRKESGKRQKWMDDESKNVQKEMQKERMAVIKAEDAMMANRVALGQATEQQLLALQTKHAEEVKKLYGEMSEEYQAYQTQLVQTTLASNQYILDSGQAVVGGLSAGFEAMFTAIAKEGADASKTMEAFARAMGRSILNSIAAAVEGEAAKGMASYLANMLMAGPWGAAAVSAYSLPLIAAMAASAGMVRGLAAMMAEGGTLTRPGLVMMAEKPSGEPETAIPLSRMDEVFAKYSHYLGKRAGAQGAGRGNTVIIQRVVDNRGAIVATSDFDKGKAAKNVGDLLTRYGVLKKGK